MIAGLNFLRFVDQDSVVHRANARTKVLALVALVFVFSFDPSWSSVAIVWTSIVVSFLLARLPRGALPRLPRVLLWSIGLALAFGLAAGGEPYVDLGARSIGVGGLLIEIRFAGVSLGLLALSLILGWTTPLAELPRAADWLLSPLRKVRLPVDDVIVVLTLAVRALPLMADELATTNALWRLRPKRHQNVMVEMVDFASTATTASVRRATELAETLTNRGAVTMARHPSTWGIADLVVGLVAAVTVGAMILVG